MKKGTWVCLQNQKQLFKNRKTSVFREKFTFHVVVSFADTQFLNMSSNILAKTKKFVKPFLPVHIGPKSNLISIKNGKKSCDPVPLRETK